MEKSSKYLIRLCQTALLISIEVVLNRFASINTPGLKIGFSFIPIAFCAICFGPIWAGAAYALSDFIGAQLFPIGTYFFGFTLSAALMGVNYGLFLGPGSPLLRNKKKLFNLGAWGWVAVCAVVFANCIVLGLFVNTAWIAVLYTKNGYWGWFVPRIAQYAVLIPLHLAVIPFLYELKARFVKAGLIKY